MKQTHYANMWVCVHMQRLFFAIHREKILVSSLNYIHLCKASEQGILPVQLVK